MHSDDKLRTVWLMVQTVLTLAIIPIVLIGCGRGTEPSGEQGFIQVKGSDTMVNAAQKVAEEFMKEHSGIQVAVTGGGSGIGIAALIDRNTDVADASREMKPKEIETARARGVSPKEFTVAHDGVALIVNKNNPVDKLTIQDLHDIFTGKATNWKQFGGKDQHIVTLSREVSSGTHMYFKEEVIQLGKSGSPEEFSRDTLLLTSSQAIVEEVAGNETAIGYLGMGYLSDRTKTLHIAKDKDSAFYSPDIEHVLKKTYPLSRPLFMYTNGEPQGAVRTFIDFTLSPKGQQQFAETGFVPINATSPAAGPQSAGETGAR
jgi:phosphate transport system substrate-binding protein